MSQFAQGHTSKIVLIFSQTYNTTKLVSSCGTNHLSSFGSAWFPEVNTIDFDFVFAHASFEGNMTIFMLIILTFIFYIIAMIWAILKDKKDLRAVRVFLP